MALSARPYQTEDREAWESLVQRSENGTLLHTRLFLSHHKDRFVDRSLVLESATGEIVGLFPAALDPTDASRIISHPGLTYGGLVHAGDLVGIHMQQAWDAIIEEYRRSSMKQLLYKAIPQIYHQRPADDDEYFLFQKGAAQVNLHLSAAVKLSRRPKLSKGRASAIKKARRSNVRVLKGPQFLSEFWHILEQNLQTKHGARPTHSLKAAEELQDLFPEHISCVVAQLDDEIIAGAYVFHTPQVLHTQYLSASLKGHELSALDLVIETLIQEAISGGQSYFNFGTSETSEGLNAGLYRYKTSFGATGSVHRFLELNLDHISSSWQESG